jgi:L-aspartate oxidase
MEFVQFHPTAMYGEGDSKRSFLVSEAVRGDGAILRNDKGEAFMQGQHPMADLAPRDIVSRAIHREMLKTGAKHVWLDATSLGTEFFSKRFPTIYSECVRRGIDPGKDYIPVCPVQHYMVGGIKTDLHGMTNIHGLYVCGEAAYTGVHGANRLASNSMLECLVFGRRSAEQMNDTVTGREDKDVELPIGEKRTGGEFDPAAVKREIQHLMYTYCGIVRTGEALSEGIRLMTELLTRLDSAPMKTKQHIEALNMAEVSIEILKAAWERKESVGTHYRES